ncbi:MAG: hypothetical protein GY871_09540, partial [Actinomycetales bacterium]|nr:hypothetical protein [Actinomycetales bacterium]
MTVHERSCGAAAATGGEASSCILCSLWRTRDQLGLRAVPDVLLHLADVGAEYKERQERDVAVFAQRFLRAARTVERDAGRCARWGSETVATHVDRLFGFWVEARSRCSSCKRTETWFESEDVLSLALPADLDRRSTLHELYLRSCAAGSIALRSTGADVRSVRCACASCGRRENQVQRRLASRPNVLLVHVRREKDDGDGSVSRHAVEIAEHLDLGDVSGLELVGVVYHTGSSLAGGRYTCACRAPDGGFFYFDDFCPGRRVTVDISQVLKACAYLLVYTRARGVAEFAGSTVPLEVAAPLQVEEREAPRRLWRKTTGEEANCYLENRTTRMDGPSAASTAAREGVGAPAVVGVAVEGVARDASVGSEGVPAGVAPPPPPRRLQRRLSRKMSDEDAMALGEEWRRYTPDVVDPCRCMGRTWNGARGGQCKKPRVHGDLCQTHHKCLACVRVDGPIPEAKLAEFKAKRQLSNAERENARTKDGGRKLRGRDVAASVHVDSAADQGVAGSSGVAELLGKRKCRDEETVLH